ncbi:putative ZIP family zinc transporter [Aspergillus mulundensis]|uniref:ZIP family zinc transporter n=1 Tax=Aspergillus mulundensis TaxID=1810919 RepID=A0A3D8S6G9_9EURO|nr:hypothetical protein DSM5745_05357 [Aspergillus mulundensis]RDW81800.1 hypothetical protein DSM5745_05357 [Aspergillus mulundensis]
MPGFVAMISVFGVVLVEMFFAMKGAGHVHGSEYDQLISDEQVDEMNYSQLAPTDNIHLSPMLENVDLRNLSPESSSTNLVKDDPVPPLNETGENQAPRVERNCRSVSNADPKMTLQNPQRQLLQCLLLEAGILFHSVFIGMAVSVATGTSFIVLLVAICFHQTFEGFALGARIASLIPDLFPPSSMKPWLMSLAYGTTTPIGQAIGLILHNFYDPASATGLLMVGITNAISSGLLLFAGLVELLAEDFLSEESYVTLRGKRRFEACIAVAAGALLMAFVGAFA